MKKLSESQIRQMISQELKNVLNENEATRLQQQVKSHIKQLASLSGEAGKDPKLSLDLADVTREFIDKFRSSDQVDPMTYVLGAASAWFSLYASDVDRE